MVDLTGTALAAGLIGHFLGDWFAQTSSMAMNKETSWWWLLAHAASASTVMLIVLQLAMPDETMSNIAYALLCGSSHFVVDRRTLVRAFMRWNGWPQPLPFWGVLALDQALHLTFVAAGALLFY